MAETKKTERCHIAHSDDREKGLQTKDFRRPPTVGEGKGSDVPPLQCTERISLLTPQV